jgi:hypothetical protein
MGKPVQTPSNFPGGRHSPAAQGVRMGVPAQARRQRREDRARLADDEAREVADELAFPNGKVVTPDNATQIVAESGSAHRTNLASTAGRQTAVMSGRAMSDKATVGMNFS